MLDHIHMIVSIPLKLSVSQFRGDLKGKSALIIFDKYAGSNINLGIDTSGQKDIM